jgi:hypothetical protein
MLVAVMLLAIAPASGCDLAGISGGRAVHEALGRRAVSIIGAATAPGRKADVLLNTLVERSASFDLVIGDVGLPGTGVAGARSFAKTINADEFRFLGWDYMDIPADACGKQSITVDFISNRDQRISRIEFTFQQARLIAAKGWQHSFESGPMPSPAQGGNGN